MGNRTADLQHRRELPAEPERDNQNLSGAQLRWVKRAGNLAFAMLPCFQDGDFYDLEDLEEDEELVISHMRGVVGVDDAGDAYRVARFRVILDLYDAGNIPDAESIGEDGHEPVPSLPLAPAEAVGPEPALPAAVHGTLGGEQGQDYTWAPGRPPSRHPPTLVNSFDVFDMSDEDDANSDYEDIDYQAFLPSDFVRSVGGGARRVVNLVDIASLEKGCGGAGAAAAAEHGADSARSSPTSIVPTLFGGSEYAGREHGVVFADCGGDHVPRVVQRERQNYANAEKLPDIHAPQEHEKLVYAPTIQSRGCAVYNPGDQEVTAPSSINAGKQDEDLADGTPELAPTNYQGERSAVGSAAAELPFVGTSHGAEASFEDAFSMRSDAPAFCPAAIPILDISRLEVKLDYVANMFRAVLPHLGVPPLGCSAVPSSAGTPPWGGGGTASGQQDQRDLTYDAAKPFHFDQSRPPAG